MAMGGSRSLRSVSAIRASSRPRRGGADVVGRGGNPRLPDAAVLGRAVGKDQEGPFTDPLVGDLESVRFDKRHC